MKTEKEILDEFGKLLIQNVFDNQFRFIKNSVADLAHTKGYENLFVGMTSIQKIEMENYTREILKGALFDFLRTFEENEQFKIKFEDDERQIDLNQISEMLKAEPIIDNGWISKFSKYK